MFANSVEYRSLDPTPSEGLEGNPSFGLERLGGLEQPDRALAEKILGVDLAASKCCRDALGDLVNEIHVSFDESFARGQVDGGSRPTRALSGSLAPWHLSSLFRSPMAGGRNEWQLPCLARPALASPEKARRSASRQRYEVAVVSTRRFTPFHETRVKRQPVHRAVLRFRCRAGSPWRASKLKCRHLQSVFKRWPTPIGRRSSLR
jgi:hypothetical protein